MTVDVKSIVNSHFVLTWVS